MLAPQDVSRLETLEVEQGCDLAVTGRERRDELLERHVDDDLVRLVGRGAVGLEELALVPPRLVPAVADPADHAVDDDAKREPSVAMPARLELAPEPLAHRLRDVLAHRPAHPRDATTADRLQPAREEEVDLPGLQQSVVLGIARILHRGVSQIGHAPILRRRRVMPRAWSLPTAARHDDDFDPFVTRGTHQRAVGGDDCPVC